MFSSVLIYGMGMMGSSLALALKKASPQTKIAGIVRSKESAKYIQEKKIVDTVYLSHQKEIKTHKILSEYKLIVFGLPIKAFLEVIPKLPSLPSLLTDMSSSQDEIGKVFLERKDLRFVHSHPLCGSENKGSISAKENLFKNHLCLVNAPSRYTKELKQIEGFWQSVGMQTCVLDSKTHDKALSYLSHVPHFLSNLLCLWASSKAEVNVLQSKTKIPPTGAGFQDMARIAGSNPEMWLSILESNQKNILIALEEFSEEIQNLTHLLKTSPKKIDTKWFEKAKQSRINLCN